MNSISIKQKLLGLAGIILVSFVAVGGIYAYSVEEQANADLENKRILDISSTVKEINIGLLKAGQFEKEFQLLTDTKYVGLFGEAMKENLSLVRTLKGLIQDQDRQRHIDELDTLFADYQNAFDKLVDLKERVGFNEKSGLMGNLRKSVQEVEFNLKQYYQDELIVSMLRMRQLEKDFIAREENKFIEAMNTEQQEFSELLENSALPDLVKSNVTSQMSTYYRDFLALTDGVKEIRAKFEIMANAASKLEPIFDKVHGMMNELLENKKLEYKAAQNRIVFVMTSTLIIVGLLMIVMVWFITQGIIQAVDKSVEIAERISEGDLLVEIEVNSKDEMGKLQSAMQKMVGRLRDIVGSVRESSGSVLQAAREISSGNMELSQRTEEQASSLEETASSMEEMTTTVKESADNAMQANSLATSTREEAKKGGEVVGKAVTAMNDIKNSSKKIADIINVVEDIAFQTNLLALNAAVEAARAGEQGRGFAVVASEVRTLAGRSAESAKEIRNLIEDSVEKVQTGSELVDKSGETLKEIVSSVTKVADIVSGMAAASHEQSAGIDQVNKAVLQMDQMTQQNSVLVEQAASASRALQDQAIQLDEVIGVFKVEQSTVSNTYQSSKRHLNVKADVDINEESPNKPGEKRAGETKERQQTERETKTGNPDSGWEEF